MRKQLIAGFVLVGAAGVLFTGWAMAQEPRGPRPPRREEPRLREALGLSDAQFDQIHRLFTEQRRAAIRRRADLQIARMDLRELMAANTLDERAVAAKAKEVADLQAAMTKARVDTLVAVRKVLTPEQVGKFRALRERDGRRPLRERMMRRWRLGPDGPGAPPPPGPEGEEGDGGGAR